MNTQEQIRLYLQKNKIGSMNAQQLAHAIGVSQSAISRFVRKETFSGFKEFKHFYAKKQQIMKNALFFNDENHLFSLQKVLNNFDYIKLATIVKIVAKKQKIIIVGKFFSEIVGQYLLLLLRKINVSARSYNSASEIDLIVPEENAAYIFISFSGKNSDIGRIMMKVKPQCRNSAFFLFTTNKKSPYLNIMNETLVGYAYQEDLDRYEVPLVSFSVLAMMINMFFERFYALNRKHNNAIIKSYKKSSW